MCAGVTERGARAEIGTYQCRAAVGDQGSREVSRRRWEVGVDNGGPAANRPRDGFFLAIFSSRCE